MARSVSKKLRFEIFKRDGFRCIYCGASPEQSVLRVDHVEPVAKGGPDEPWNLVTACFDCNAGKKDRRLEESALPSQSSLEEALEHVEQMKAFLAVQKDLYQAEEESIRWALESWEPITDEDFNRARALLKRITAKELKEAVEIAVGRFSYPNKSGSSFRADRVWKYVYGIVRNWESGK